MAVKYPRTVRLPIDAVQQAVHGTGSGLGVWNEYIDWIVATRTLPHQLRRQVTRNSSEDWAANGPDYVSFKPGEATADAKRHVERTWVMESLETVTETPQTVYDASGNADPVDIYEDEPANAQLTSDTGEVTTDTASPAGIGSPYSVQPTVTRTVDDFHMWRVMVAADNVTPVDWNYPDAASWEHDEATRDAWFSLGTPDLNYLLKPGEWFVSGEMVVFANRVYSGDIPQVMDLNTDPPDASIIVGPAPRDPPHGAGRYGQLASYVAQKPRGGRRIPYLSLPRYPNNRPTTKGDCKRFSFGLTGEEVGKPGGPRLRFTLDLGDGALASGTRLNLFDSSGFPWMFHSYQYQESIHAEMTMRPVFALFLSWLDVVIEGPGPAETPKPPRNVYHRAYQDLANRRRG